MFRWLQAFVVITVVAGSLGMSFPAAPGLSLAAAATRCGSTQDAVRLVNQDILEMGWRGGYTFQTGATVTCPGDLRPLAAWDPNQYYLPPLPTSGRIQRGLDSGEFTLTNNPSYPGVFFLWNAAGRHIGQLRFNGAGYVVTIPQLQLSGGTVTHKAVGVLTKVPAVVGICDCVPQG